MSPLRMSMSRHTQLPGEVAAHEALTDERKAATEQLEPQRSLFFLTVSFIE
jgi:hypothetical protein